MLETHEAAENNHRSLISPSLLRTTLTGTIVEFTAVRQRNISSQNFCNGHLLVPIFGSESVDYNTLVRIFDLN